MIILDTNVISEGFRARPNAQVLSWLDAQVPDELLLCTPVLAELRFGVERLPPGPRRSDLDQSISNAEENLFHNRILTLDRESAYEFGRVVAMRTELGRPISPMDAMIAAIAIANRVAIATRDIHDFAGLAIELVNPFEALAER